jgi:putative endopeptidase
MRKGKLLSVILALALTLSVLAGCSAPEQPDTSAPLSRTPVSESVSAKRVDDFYAAINAAVLKEHENSDGNWNWFFDLENKSFEEQKRILQAVSAVPGEAGSSEYKLGTLYALALDQKKRDAESAAYFNELMKPVMEASTIEELMDVLAVLRYRYGLDVFLNTEVLALDDNPGEYIAQIGDMNFALDVRDFDDREMEAENRAYFTDYLARLLTLAGRQDGEKAASEVYDFVRTVAMSCGEANYTKIPVDDLQQILTNIDLQAYLGKIFRTMPTELNIKETASLSKLNGFLTNDNLPVLKNYVYLINLQRLAPYMTSDMATAKYEADMTYIGDADPIAPENTAVKQVATLLKWDMGKLYTEKNFTAEKQAAVNAMVEEMIAEYEMMLQEEDWLSQATRDRATGKLKAIRLRIGAPEDIDRYLSTYVPDPDKGYLENVMALRRETTEKLYNSYGQPVDRTVWQILPQELTPCYYPTDNSINIPVSVLEAPYFDPATDEAKNLGALGTIIGHEITHAFDDLGSQYDENGDFVNWWTDTDRKAFEERAEKIVTYYNNYKTPGIMRQDGKQTLGENIADLGSMRCLTRIVEKKNLSAEQFFESYANSWASTSDAFSDAIIAGVDEHAADKVRVNAVLGSCELFYQTYNVKDGDGMYIRPENRVGLW